MKERKWKWNNVKKIMKIMKIIIMIIMDNNENE